MSKELIGGNGNNTPHVIQFENDLIDTSKEETPPPPNINISLALREIQIKTTRRYHVATVIMT